MKLYFDACIWIDYLWGVQEKSTPKKEIQDLLASIEKHHCSVVSSVFLHTEISCHFKDWHILQKIMRAGYSYRDLPNLKKKKKWSNLSDTEKRQINGRLESISKLPWVESVELSSLEKSDLDIFSTLTLEYHLDFADAFHIIIAMIESCRFLITRDQGMIENAREFLKDYSLEKEFEILKPKELLNRF